MLLDEEGRVALETMRRGITSSATEPRRAPALPSGPIDAELDDAPMQARR